MAAKLQALLEGKLSGGQGVCEQSMAVGAVNEDKVARVAEAEPPQMAVTNDYGKVAKAVIVYCAVGDHRVLCDVCLCYLCEGVLIRLVRNP